MSALKPVKILYLDLIGGAAGDMLMAALVDAGASLDRIREVVSGLGLDRVRIFTKTATPGGLRARQIDVMIGDELADREHIPAEAVAEAETRYTLLGKARGPKIQTAHAAHRSYTSIRELLEKASLPDRTRAIALGAFRLLAEAEAHVHGVDIDQVEFHEVGADDAITDIVGVATAIEELAPDEIVVSPVPVARGLTKGAHGPIPLPAPATIQILIGAPLVETPLAGELVTPTGAALLRTIATRFGPVPSMTVRAIGVGGGHKQWPDRPNVVRALIGDTSSSTATHSGEIVIETNIDDMSPQHFAALEKAIFDAGAMDVWSTAIQMKKGRAGRMVSALVADTLKDAVIQAFFMHSTTLGVRMHDVTRQRAERIMITAETAYGVIRVKISPRPSGPDLVMPEHDDCEKQALAHGVSIRVVWEAALRTASK